MTHFYNFLILSSVLIARYFLLSGFFEYMLKHFKGRPLSRRSQRSELKKSDMFHSAVSSVVFALSGTLLIALWQHGATKIYFNYSKYPIWYAPLSFFVVLLIHDTYFYWTHRLLHISYFQKWHFVHHRSKNPTAWTSFSFHPLEACIQAFIIPLLVVSIPLHWSVLAGVLVLMTVFGITNHLGHEIYPSFFEKKMRLITARHHQEHHENVSCNYGLYFTFWDLLMKTERK